MAKYVIAGKANCPFYARAELLADELKLRLPDFAVHKIVVKDEDWQNWVEILCKENNWTYNGESPLIWREIINRGGKGLLVGSCNDFMETVKGYYGITCMKSTNKLEKMAAENVQTKDVLEAEEKQRKAEINPINISLLNANNDVIYNVIPLMMSDIKSITDGRVVFLNLHYSSIEDGEALAGLVMEIQDCSFSSLTAANCSTNLEIVLKDSDLIIIPCTAESIDLTLLNIWKEYGMMIKNVAKHDAKIIAFGKHATTAIYVFSQMISNLPRENFFAVTRLEENKVKSELAKKLEVLTAGISDVLVWGPSEQLIIDHSISTATGYNGAIWAPHIDDFNHEVNEMIYEKTWLAEELPKTLEPSDSARKNSISLAAAFCTQLRDIMNPSKPGIYSLGLISKGWYDVPENLVFSFPVTYSKGCVQVVDNLSLSDEVLEEIQKAAIMYQKSLDEYMNQLN